MKLIFSNRSFPRLRSCARLFIVSVFSLCSFSVFAQDANTAAIASDVESILQSLNWALRNPISSDSGYIPERLDDLLEYDTATYKFLTGRTSTTASINYNDKNALPYLLGSVVYGLTGWAPNSSQPLDHSLHGDLTIGNQTLSQLLALLHNISNVVAQSASTVVVSNFVSVTNSGGAGVVSPDILAGNPFWLTNTTFAVNWDDWSKIQPQPRLRYPSLSFVELLSVMMAQRTVGLDSSIHSFNDYYSSFGADPNNSAINWKGTGLTWYDWIADAFKSNFTSQSTYNYTLLNALRNLSNEVNDSSAYIANHLDYGIGDITNVLISLHQQSFDNPWWFTNSAFAVTWDQWQSGFVPKPHSSDLPYGFAFPYVLSMFMSQIVDNESEANFWDEWGLGGQNEYTPLDGSESHLTWFDWVSEALKSNMVLNTSSSYSNLVAEVSQYDTSDDLNPTNVPLPEYSLPDSETVAGASDTLSSAESGLIDKIESMQPNYTGGDDEIVVIPSFSVGGINVREYRARLGTSITPVCRRVASFIWYVGLFAFLFAFAKSEFVYYATLGKFWVRKG